MCQWNIDLNMIMLFKAQYVSSSTCIKRIYAHREFKRIYDCFVATMRQTYHFPGHELDANEIDDLKIQLWVKLNSVNVSSSSFFFLYSHFLLPLELRHACVFNDHQCWQYVSLGAGFLTLLFSTADKYLSELSDPPVQTANVSHRVNLPNVFQSY